MKNKKALSAFFASLLSVLAAWGVYKPAPKPQPSPTPEASATPAPTVEPTALPSPTTAATSTPAPSPTAPPCDLAPSRGSCDWTPEGRAEFEDRVFLAQEIAKDNGYLTPNGQVKDEALYTNEVARILRTMGFCAINGRVGGHTSDDEIWVKKWNSASEHFDIVRHDGYPITLFASRCIPAHF